MFDPQMMSQILMAKQAGAPQQLAGPGMQNPFGHAESQAQPSSAGDMSQILGMEAIKGMMAGARESGGGQQLSSPAPVAPRGNQVQLETPAAPAAIDPRMYLMMAGRPVSAGG